MNQADIAALMEGIAPVMRGFVEATFRPLADRLAALEKRLDADMPAIVAIRDEVAGFAPMLERQAAALGETLTAGLAASVKGEVAALPPAPAGKDADPEVVKQLVADAVEALPKPQDGKSVTADELRPLIAEFVGAAMAEIPTPENGKDVDPETVRAMVKEAVAALPPAPAGKDADPEIMKAAIADEVGRQVAALPSARDGKDVDPEVVKALVAEEVTRAMADRPEPLTVAALEQAVAEAVKALPPAKDGASITPEDVRPMLEQLVGAGLAALPAPKDGKSITVEDVRPVIEEAAAKAVAAIPAPKDGVGLAGAVIDRNGNLVVTLSDGTTKSLGPVLGRDGDDGEPGLAFDDMTEELADDGRTIVRRYSRGDQVKEFRHTFAVVLDRGVFKEGTTYTAGDAVTFGGSLWIAKRETTAKPGTNDDFRLAVKKGRDGKDAEMPKPPAVVKL